MSSININFNIDGWNSSLAALALMGFQEPVKELENILRDCLHVKPVAGLSRNVLGWLQYTPLGNYNKYFEKL